jgi:uncharacterized protein
MIEFFILILIGLIAAFMSSISGAGTALFSIPLLLIAGVPMTEILAANQVSSSIWTPIASRRYLGNVKVRWSLVLGVGAFGIIGVLIGTTIIEFIPVPTLKRIMGGIILVVIFFIWTKKDFYVSNINKKAPSSFSLLWGLPLGLYQSIFGAASMFSSLMFCKVHSLSLHQSLAYAYAVAFPWCLCAAIAFFLKGWVVWSVAIPFSLGSTLGAFIGSNLGSSISAKSLRKVILLFGAFMGAHFLLNA